MRVGEGSVLKGSYNRCKTSEVKIQGCFFNDLIADINTLATKHTQIGIVCEQRVTIVYRQVWENLGKPPGFEFEPHLTSDILEGALLIGRAFLA